MTTFRFSALSFMLLSACQSGPTNLPDANTPLGQIARISNFEERSAALKKFAEANLANPARVRAEFAAAGFKSSTFKDGDQTCQSYDWKSEGMMVPVVMLVNICDGEISANSGQQAP